MKALFFVPSTVALSRIAIAEILATDGTFRIELEPGAPSPRELGVPLLQGMDEIVVDTAEFDLQTASKITDAPFTRPPMPTGEKGVLIAFADDVRLTHVELDTATSVDGSSATDSADVARLVIRPAKKQGGGYKAGPPAYVQPAFPAGMFGALLGGMSVANHSGNNRTASFPPIAGTAFVVQFAKGDSPTSLQPLDAAVNVTHASVDAAPKDLAVALKAGTTSLPVWNHAGVLLPGMSQTVSFRPMAEKLLNERLNSAASETTLSVSLNFSAATSSAISITSPKLAATYTSRPSDQPRRIELRGSRERVGMDAPAALAPETTSLTLAAKFLGRELNGAYDAAPDEVPPSALRVNASRSVAALAPLLPLPGSPDGSAVGVAALRLFLAAADDGEVAIELHADAGNAPGSMIAPQSVRQFPAAFAGWTEIVIPSAVPIATGRAAVWIVLRATRGEVLWCCDRAATIPALVSTDGATSWGDPTSLLEGSVSPRLQLFHVLPSPDSVSVELSAGTVHDQWTLPRTSPGSEQFVVSTSFPPPLRTLLGQTSGTGRVRTELRLFSRSVIDLTLDALTLSYKPPTA